MILSEGTYFIGDPQFAFTALSLKELLKNLDTGSENPVKEIQGHQLWLHRTDHGPGVFSDQDGMTYSSKTGLFCVVPMEVVENPECQDHGTVIQFDNSFAVKYDEGFFYVGHVVINTSLSAHEAERQVFKFDGGYNGDLTKDAL